MITNSKSKMHIAFLVLLVFVFISPAHAVDESVVWPQTYEPQCLCDNLDKESKDKQYDLAEKFHSEQLVLFESITDESERKHELYMAGIQLALEEYCAMELSYPPAAEYLMESGYLLDGWSEYGFSVSDCSERDESLTGYQIIYVAQPLGLAELRRVPGMGCQSIRRCFDEYSLAVPGETADLWGEAGVVPGTFWMEPYTRLGLVEVSHVLNEHPVLMQCEKPE